MANTYLDKFKTLISEKESELLKTESTDPAVLQYQQMQKMKTKGKEEYAESQRLERLREVSGNPVYGMSREEALKFSVQMGASDTFRGIGQLLNKGLNIESLDKKLKGDYKKFEAILGNEEYGTEAFVSFLSSAIALDPASYVPILGWMKKAKHANTLWKTTKYAGKSGFIIGGLGYTPEEAEGFITDADDSFLMKKLEQAGITAAAAMTLIGLGAGAVDLVYKAKTGKSIFAGSNEVISKDANTKLDDTEKVINRPLQKGDFVIAPDRGNTGKITHINKEDGTARVLFVNKENGTSARKNFKLDELQPKEPGTTKQSTTKPIDDSVDRPEEAVFIYNKAGDLVARDNKTKTIYKISKALNEEGNIIKGQWEVTIRPNITRKKGESIQALNRRKKNSTEIKVVGSKEKAKKLVEDLISPSSQKVIPVTDEKLVNNLIDEHLKLPDEKTKDTTPFLERWENGGGKLAWEAVQRNPIEFVTTTGGAVVGYTSPGDTDATESERMFRAVLGASAAYAFAKTGKTYDLKFNEGSFFKYIQRKTVSDYGLDENHLLRRQKFYSDKNEIMKQFKEVAKDIFKNATEEEQQILYQFMNGEITDMAKTFDMLRNLSDDGRKLITEYARELVDRGLLAPETFQKHLKTYLHRSYAFHEARKLNFSKTAMFDVEKTIRIMGDELKPRGVRDTVSRKVFEDPDGDWQKEGWEILGDDLPTGKRKSSDKLTVRRDLTKTERLQLEEIENASYALLETGKLLGNDVSAARFFDDIAADSNITMTEKQWEKLTPAQQKEWVQITKTTVLGT